MSSEIRPHPMNHDHFYPRLTGSTKSGVMLLLLKFPDKLAGLWQLEILSWPSQNSKSK
jgi:hypothetical protein